MVLDWNVYKETARRAVAEGNVLLTNHHHVLPIQKGSCVSVFGRIQTNYYKSGTGSGGMVNVDHVTGILEALKDSEEITVNEELLSVYEEWEKEHPFDKGVGWGAEPWSQEEMEIGDDIVEKAAAESDIAVVILGRTAGEDQDNLLQEGSYLLTEKEMNLLKQVRKAFSKMVVILNVGNIIDMSFEEEVKPDAVLYAWQGGMVGGSGTIDVLLGRTNPSGRLTDTIAYQITDYPSAPYFGDSNKNFYAEDIYVGYRYFETVNKDAVKYPFGYGLSYTEFVHEIKNQRETEDTVSFDIEVTNTGSVPGKEVLQIYVKAPQGKLGKPSVVLAAFDKTELLGAGESVTVSFALDKNSFASYDDSGVTGFEACYVLEAGTYTLYDGKNARELSEILTFEYNETTVVEKRSHVLMPIEAFDRMKPQAEGEGYRMVMEQAPVSENVDRIRRAEHLPQEIPQTKDMGYRLKDVRDGKISMDQFVAQLTDEDLSCIIRGEGMGSPKVTAGTAAAFGGISKRLKDFGVPCGCCADGPSGIRMDSGKQAFSLPNGTLLACTFNEKLSEELFYLLGLEMGYQKVDALLGPGMNIHRYPLNGRNFEYFSEDPLVTGKIGAAQLRGLKKAGVTGTMKHFCANNQERRRHFVESIVSERALREIYLKGFEIAVKEAGADSVMTTYGLVNGGYTAGKYELNTTMLRDEWGFQGIVMTDWWAKVGDTGDSEGSLTDFAQMVRSQNDLYMVCSEACKNSSGDNTMESLTEGTLTRGELQRSAKNILAFLMHTRAFARMNGELEEHEIVNRPEDPMDMDDQEIVFYPIPDTEYHIDLSGVDSGQGSKFSFGLDVERLGGYEIELVAKSDLGELAQIPVTLFFQNFPLLVFTFNGTNGKWTSVKKNIILHSKYETMSLHFGRAGIEVKELIFRFEKDKSEISFGGDYIEEEMN